MAKDTEKLIRQLSLISYLMAERRTVTATEIRRDVEGYSDMTEDAFARRFYADRAELESLGIDLAVDRPADGLSEQENYSLAPEAFHLPAIAFSDEELAALHTTLALLDGEFAYAEPLRLALQQICWGRPSPLSSPAHRTLALGIKGSAGGAELSQRLAKIDTAIYRRKTIEFEYYTISRDATAMRRVDPYLLLFRPTGFQLVGHAHDRNDIRVFNLERIRGKVAYATKAEHDFQRPADFDPRDYANRIDWQLGDSEGCADIWVSERIAWQVERHWAQYGEMRSAEDDSAARIFRTEYAAPRLLIGWVLRLGEYARVVGPGTLAEEAARRIELLAERHRDEPVEIPAAAYAKADAARRAAEQARATGSHRSGSRRSRGGGDNAIRPERFARLVTLASVLIDAGRRGERLRVRELGKRLHMTESELREDISVLNVVNFGGGAYVLYAEIFGGEIEVDPEPYSDTFDRPARLLPIEAKALIAAIDLIGDHDPEGWLANARARIVAALGNDPVEEGLQVSSAQADDSSVAQVINRAILEQRPLFIRYYKPNEDEITDRTIEPYKLANGAEGWYVAAVDPAKDDGALRHFRLDRIKRVELLDGRYELRPEVDPQAAVEGWMRTGEIEDSGTARVWIAPDQARWVREKRTVVAELDDGSIVVDWSYKGTDFLVKEILREAGDAAVLEPADVRERVLAVAEQLLAPVRG